MNFKIENRLKKMIFSIRLVRHSKNNSSGPSTPVKDGIRERGSLLKVWNDDVIIPDFNRRAEETSGKSRQAYVLPSSTCSVIKAAICFVQ